MATVEFKEPKMIVIEYRQEKSDEDYGECLWARFTFDLTNYTLSIESDCGNYVYGWVPTPQSESFLKLCSRLDEGYLLEKLSNRTVISGDDTWKNIKDLISQVTEYEIVKTDWDMDDIRIACHHAYDERDAHDRIEEAIKYTSLDSLIEDCEIWECIEKDYPVNAKKIVQVYHTHIIPAIKERLEVEGK